MNQPERNIDEKARLLAQRCAEAMLSEDEASRLLGMRLVAVGEGWAEVSMTVRKDMISGHGLIHGGMVFTLADTTFALACNSRNKTAYAMSCTIDFVRPALLGDELTAVATEQSHTRSSGVYEITVSNQHGKPVAHFRGRSFTRGEPLIENED